MGSRFLPSIFILLCFVSSIGDSLFLSGLPLHLYHQKRDIVATSYVPLIIVVAVLASSAFTAIATRISTLVFVAAGELVMGIVEIGILLVYTAVPTTLTLLIGTGLLALIYNMYAAAKYFHLQPFFSSQPQQLATYQSAAIRAGSFVGIALSGYLVEKVGFAAVLSLDAGTFVLFGSGMLICAWAFGSIRRLSVVNTPIPILHRQTLPRRTTFVFAGIVVVYSQWEQASGVATGSVLTGYTLSTLGILRGICGSIGAIIAAVLPKVPHSCTYLVWIWGVVFICSVVPVLNIFHSAIAFILMFILGGMLTTLLLPIQRSLYLSKGKSEREARSTSAQQWIYNSLLRSSLLPILVVSTSAGSDIGILNWALGLAAVVGTCGGLLGYVVYSK